MLTTAHICSFRFVHYLKRFILRANSRWLPGRYYSMFQNYRFACGIGLVVLSGKFCNFTEAFRPYLSLILAHLKIPNLCMCSELSENKCILP